jgi:hypothetical protein
MAIFVFALALVLALGGGGGLIASIDLMPTDVGILYAACGVIALSGACIVAAIGGLIVRVDQIGARVKHALMAEEEAGPFHHAHPVEAAAPAPVLAPAPAPEPEPAAEPAPFAEPRTDEEEDAVNENRAGHLPTFVEIEETIAHPEPSPRLIGRYSAGGANYAIYSDGSVEAEMAEGQYNFNSMSDFRAFLEDRRG